MNYTGDLEIIKIDISLSIPTHQTYNYMTNSSIIEIGDFIKLDGQYGIVKKIEHGIAYDHNGNGYDLGEIITTIKSNKNDTQHDLILKGLRATMDQYSFRIQGTYIERAGFSGNPFFFGFTGKADMYHLEVKTVNHPEILPTVVYYQAGNYADLKLNDGSFEFGDIYDKQHSLPTGTYMMGLIGYRADKPRFIKWTYAKDQLYKLYILIMYGDSYYMFYGMSKQQIIDSLEVKDSNLKMRDITNPHYYQAFAHVCYYNEDIPASYGLDGLKEKIISQFTWIKELHNTL